VKPACGNQCGCNNCIFRVRTEVLRALSTLPAEAQVVALAGVGVRAKVEAQP
jgi:hypothetical protein